MSQQPITASLVTTSPARDVCGRYAAGRRKTPPSYEGLASVARYNRERLNVIANNSIADRSPLLPVPPGNPTCCNAACRGKVSAYVDR